jgi:hypothetical protein
MQTGDLLTLRLSQETNPGMGFCINKMRNVVGQTQSSGGLSTIAGEQANSSAKNYLLSLQLFIDLFI